MKNNLDKVKCHIYKSTPDYKVKIAEECMHEAMNFLNTIYEDIDDGWWNYEWRVRPSSSKSVFTHWHHKRNIRPVIEISGISSTRELYWDTYARKRIGVRAYHIKCTLKQKIILHWIHELTHYIQYKRGTGFGEIEPTRNEIVWTIRYAKHLFKQLKPISDNRPKVNGQKITAVYIGNKKIL